MASVISRNIKMLTIDLRIYNYDIHMHAGRPNTKPRRPVLKDLLNELVSVNDWQLLMINMGVEKFENDKIERNHPNDIERQKQEAFEKWLKTKPDACWKDVIDALYKMKEITLASSLEKKYAWKDPRVLL